MEVRYFLCLLIISLALPAAGQTADTGAAVPAITAPSADVTLSFIQPGRIDTINFKEGDVVKIGDSLVQQYDAVQKAQLAQLEAESQNTTQIQASEAKLAQSKVDLERKSQAAEKGAAPPTEVEYARLNLTIAELALRLATFQHDQAVRKFQEAKLQLDNMRLTCPIDGKIEELFIEAGESVNALDKVIRVVRIDPLWVDVRVPLSQATNINNGNPAVVEFTGTPKASFEGIVIFKAAVADGASETLKVRIQVSNRTARQAGEHVKVSFPSIVKKIEENIK